jgi:peroxiredoxin
VKRDLQVGADASAVAEILDTSLTQSGESIAALSAASPVLVVFLRHAGCIFCRETLRDIARERAAMERNGTRIVLVHMGDIQAIERSLSKYKLSDLDQICDPRQELYRAFGLKGGTFPQLFGWKVTWRSVCLGLLHGVGPKTADASQMPGVFLIHRCAVVRRFRHKTAADRPNYGMLCEQLSPQ